MTIAANVWMYAALLAAGQTDGAGQERLWLVRGGQSQAVIVAGRDDEYLLQKAQQVAKELRLTCSPAGESR